MRVRDARPAPLVDPDERAVPLLLPIAAGTGTSGGLGGCDAHGCVRAGETVVLHMLLLVKRRFFWYNFGGFWNVFLVLKKRLKIDFFEYNFKVLFLI